MKSICSLFIFAITLSCSMLFSCCTTKDNSQSPEAPVNWEGHESMTNQPYQDSILFASWRRLGNSYSPTVYLVYKDGSGIRPLTDSLNITFASWSPRRWKILFVSSPSISEHANGLFVANYDFTGRRRITPVGVKVNGRPGWSPDGSTIAYIEFDTTAQSNRRRLVLVDPDGANPRIRSGWMGDIITVTWSKDSRRIAFDGNSSSGSLINVVSVDGGGPTPLFLSSEGCYHPAWSPDGKYVAFMSVAYVDGQSFGKIFVYEVSTASVRQVTTGKSQDYTPTWSPDSRTIVFNSQDALFKIPLDGGTPVRLTDGTSIDYWPSWFN
jgi:Tol biopolymer transport system component